MPREPPDNEQGGNAEHGHGIHFGPMLSLSELGNVYHDEADDRGQPVEQYGSPPEAQVELR